jgi:hypothetical protein
MKPPEIFGLILRVFGLILFLYSLWLIGAAFLRLAGVKGPYDFASYFFPGAMTAIFSIYFLRGAPHLVRFSYPKVKDGSSKDVT